MPDYNSSILYDDSFTNRMLFIGALQRNEIKLKRYIEYFMESARVRCLHTSCGVSEIEQVSEANEWDFWYKTTSV